MHKIISLLVRSEHRRIRYRPRSSSAPVINEAYSEYDTEFSVDPDQHSMTIQPRKRANTAATDLRELIAS